MFGWLFGKSSRVSDKVEVERVATKCEVYCLATILIGVSEVEYEVRGTRHELALCDFFYEGRKLENMLSGDMESRKSIYERETVNKFFDTDDGRKLWCAKGDVNRLVDNRDVLSFRFIYGKEETETSVVLMERDKIRQGKEG